MTFKSSPSFSLERAVYPILSTKNGIYIDCPTKNGKLFSKRRQCAMYCNDVIGIPGYFSDLFVEKKRRITQGFPSVGSVALFNIAAPYGHVLVVEEVYPDGKITWSESNYDDKENFRRMTGTVDDLKKRGLVGFTEGLQITTDTMQELEEWEKEAVKFVQDTDISKGDRPRDTMTRAEGFSLVRKLYLYMINKK